MENKITYKQTGGQSYEVSINGERCGEIMKVTKRQMGTKWKVIGNDKKFDSRKEAAISLIK